MASHDGAFALASNKLWFQGPTRHPDDFQRRNVRDMERITARSEGDFYTALYGSLWAVALSIIWFFCRADPEAPVKYTVEPPEEAKPGWKGELLEEPTLKVCEVGINTLDIN